jgi:PRTRC genetic system protein D
MYLGYDGGFSDAKAKTDNGKIITFPTISGNYEQATYAIEAANAPIVVTIPGDGTWVIGEAAAHVSRLTARRQDRHWITTPAWKRYFLAAVTQLTTATRLDLDLVTGLPVTWYAQDWQDLVAHIRGTHRVKRLGGTWQTITVRNIEVLPQPFGTLLAQVLDEHGTIVNTELANRKVAIIDIGGNTTGYLAVDELHEIPFQTTSIDRGCWEALALTAQEINRRFPGLEIEDPEVLQLVKAHQTIDYYDKIDIDVSHIVTAALQPLAAAVIGHATTLWNSGAEFRRILVTGGGAHLIGDHIKGQFPHATIVHDPALANARGYYNFAKRLYG